MEISSSLSGDMDRIKHAFSGHDAEMKVTPEIEGHVRDRFYELFGNYRNYSLKIREEVKKYFLCRYRHNGW